MTTSPEAIVPESKDWTYVITDGCAECGFKPTVAPLTGALLRATIPAWRAALADPEARTRPAATVWSPVEYACHVRDTCRIFRERLGRMLTEDDPRFANWDQDATAIADDYFHADPAVVIAQLEREAEATASAFDAVAGAQWRRPGRRSDGASFTVETFAVYFLHDVVHHVHDVARP